MSTSTSAAITLKGSVEIVSEFFGYSINSILYQRGIYPPESFRRVNKYGLTMLVTADDGLSAYLGNVLSQLTEWLNAGTVQKLVVVVSGQQSGEALERWVFDVHTDKSIGPDDKVDKPQKEVTRARARAIRAARDGAARTARPGRQTSRASRAGDGGDPSDHPSDHRVGHLPAAARRAVLLRPARVHRRRRAGSSHTYATERPLPAPRGP